MKRTFAPLALAAFAVAAAGCGTSTSQTTGQASTSPPPKDVVIVQHMSFIPHVITVKAGTTVTWSFQDGLIPHNATFASLSTGSPNLRDGTWKHTFDTPGTYTYRCTLHAQMTGVVVVQPS